MSAVSMPTHALLHLLTLASTALPIGAYCYSQGVETAIELGIIHNEHSALLYFEEVLHVQLIAYELPMLKQLINAVPNVALFHRMAQHYKAMRETQELRAESQQMATALLQWVRQVKPISAEAMQGMDQYAGYGFLPLYAYLMHILNVPQDAALPTYAFSVLENQVLAAVKTVPLGQMAGQRILWQLHPPLVDAVARILLNKKGYGIPLNASLPYLGWMSMRHEKQYSRLFRS